MNENEFLINLLNRMEDKMVEVMGVKAYSIWAAETARDMFRLSVENMEKGDFKDYILEHFEEITK